MPSLSSIDPIKRVEKYSKKQITKAVLEDDFPKLASVENGKVQIKDMPLLFFISLVWDSQRIIRLSKKAFVDIEKHLLMISKSWWIVTASKMLR